MLVFRVAHRVLYLGLIIGVFWLSLAGQAAQAAGGNSCGVAPDTGKSALLPAKNLRLYNLKWAMLTEKQRVVVKNFGLMGLPLDPRIWGIRAEDEFSAAPLVWVRPFYLRVSESPGFQVEEASIEFGLPDDAQADAQPAVIDFLFGGAFVPAAGSGEPLVDSTYMLRIEAAVNAEVTFLFRSRSAVEELARLENIALQPARRYVLTVKFSPQEVTCFLDGVPLLGLRGAELNRGLTGLKGALRTAAVYDFKLRAQIGTLPQGVDGGVCVLGGLVALPEEHVLSE